MKIYFFYNQRMLEKETDKTAQGLEVKESATSPLSEAVLDSLLNETEKSFRTYLIFIIKMSSIIIDLDTVDHSFDSSESFDYVNEIAKKEAESRYAYNDLKPALASVETSYIPCDNESQIEAFPRFHYSFCLDGIHSKEEALLTAKEDPLFKNIVSEGDFEINYIQTADQDTILKTSLEFEENCIPSLFIPINQYPKENI